MVPDPGRLAPLPGYSPEVRSPSNPGPAVRSGAPKRARASRTLGTQGKHSWIVAASLRPSLIGQRDVMMEFVQENHQEAGFRAVDAWCRTGFKGLDRPAVIDRSDEPTKPGSGARTLRTCTSPSCAARVACDGPSSTRRVPEHERNAVVPVGYGAFGE